MSLVHNERTKLTATYLNGLAIALFAVGAVAPAIAIMSTPTATTSRSVVVVALVCIAASSALHYCARYVLGRLRP